MWRRKHRVRGACATIATQTGACCRLMAMKGDAGVLARSVCCGSFAALTAAFALCGCAAPDTSSWFSKPLNPFGNNLGYSYSQLGETRQDHPITANDLVDPNGACPRYTAPAPVAPGSPDAGSAASPDTAALLSGGIALGMSECDVVARLGQPTAVNLGSNPNGSRSAVLTFKSGPRPGIYRFAGGRLSEMDRVEGLPPPQPEKKKSAKKKPANSKEPQKPGDKT